MVEYGQTIQPRKFDLIVSMGQAYRRWGFKAGGQEDHHSNGIPENRCTDEAEKQYYPKIKHTEDRNLL